MSRLSIVATAAVLSALTATPVVFAKEHHHRVRKAQGYAIPRWPYAAPRAPIHYDVSPSYSDASKFGGGTALPVTR